MRTPFLAPFATFLAIGLVLPALGADEERSDVVTKSFPATGGGKLVIVADRGSLTVEGGDGNEAVIEVTRKVVRGSGKKAAELLQRHHVTFSQDGRTIRVDADLEGKDSSGSKSPQLEVAIRAKVPREFDLDGSTAGGSVHITRLKGEIAVKTAGGSLDLEDLSGNIHGRTSGGSIKGAALTGAVDVSTSGGGVTLNGISGERLKAGTSGGSIRLTGVAVPAEAKTSGGSVTIETSAFPLEASTSGGSIDATLTASPGADVNLKTSAGGITLSLPEKSAFQLDAATSAGGVRSDFPVTMTRTDSDEHNHSTLRGPVNGGGPTVKLRTSAGSVRIRKS